MPTEIPESNPYLVHLGRKSALIPDEHILLSIKWAGFLAERDKAFSLWQGGKYSGELLREIQLAYIKAGDEANKIGEFLLKDVPWGTEVTEQDYINDAKSREAVSSDHTA